VQVDEAKIRGNPDNAPLAAAAINRVLDEIEVMGAVHLCFGNNGGQTIQSGTGQKLIGFLNALHANHVVLDMARASPRKGCGTPTGRRADLLHLLPFRPAAIVPGGLPRRRHPAVDGRRIFAMSEGQLGECSISNEGEWLTVAFQSGGRRGLAVGRTNGTQWREIPFPRTAIHPQFHPLDREWMEFSGDPAPCMHRVRHDGTGTTQVYVVEL
jgi:hypothetical protein